MRAVGVRELKNRLSEYLRAVRAGEAILVTHRGEVVAEIHRPGEQPADGDLPPGIAALVREGVLTPPRRGREATYRSLPPLAPGIDVLKLLDEERGDR